MYSAANYTTMIKDYSNKRLQNLSFTNANLVGANFTNSDLRGTDFSGADLTIANFTNAKTGIPPLDTAIIFLTAMVVSLFSGYMAMLAGHTIQGMLASKDANVSTAAIGGVVIIILFIVYYWWKGGGNAIRYLLLPAIGVAVVIGLVAYLSGAGTGMGMLYLVLAYFLVGVMFIVGTVSRAAAGTLSSTIIFLTVALGGGMFSRSIGGGIGTIVMALSCAQISKRALSGAKGFGSLQKIAVFITSRFGTSFKNTNLSGADFSGAKIRNADFSNADISNINWAHEKKVNCIGVDKAVIKPIK
jgi:uncharacterized protein YjbI with pentapeptide repeats